MATKQKAYIALVLTSTVWGTSWIASKIGIRHVPALEIASIRQFIAGTLFIVFFLLKGEKMPSAKQFAWLTMMAVLLFVSANGIATLALKNVSSGLGALIAALYPLCVVIIERVFFRNHSITFVTFTGLLLGFGGIFFVFYNAAFDVHPQGYATGIILSVIAMLSWSIGTIVLSRSSSTMNPYYATGWQMMISSLILILMLFISGNIIPLSQVPLQAWGAITYLVVMSNIITFVAFVYTIKNLDPAIAALYAYINPIVAILTGSVLIDEKLTYHMIIGSLITIAGVFVVNRSIRKQKAVLEADAM